MNLLEIFSNYLKQKLEEINESDYFKQVSITQDCRGAYRFVRSITPPQDWDKFDAIYDDFRTMAIEDIDKQSKEEIEENTEEKILDKTETL